MPADLEGIVATSTRLSHVDGEAGRLTIAGYAVEDLAPYASFEEVAYLLLHARLPEPAELFGSRRISPGGEPCPARDLRYCAKPPPPKPPPWMSCEWRRLCSASAARRTPWTTR